MSYKVKIISGKIDDPYLEKYINDTINTFIDSASPGQQYFIQNISTHIIPSFFWKSILVYIITFRNHDHSS